MKLRAMKFVVDLATKQSGRIGSLAKADFELKTPLVLHYTKAASIPHLSRDTFNLLKSENQGVQVSVETTSSFEEALKSFQKGITAFSGLDNVFSLITLKDTGAITASQYSRTSVVVSGRAGNISITPEKYMDLIEAFKPDIFHTLCDGDTNETSPNKRIYNATNRTESFFRGCVDLYKTSPTFGQSMLIAPIEGGYSAKYREETIKFLNSCENQDIIGGYFIDGLHNNGESAIRLNANNVCKIVEKCTELLPINKLKIMLGAYSPSIIVRLVKLGIDVFDTTYAYLATTSNQALTFNFDINVLGQKDCKFCIDLTDQIFKDDFKPFVERCQCLACQNHTRAYTQHLIHTKELLAPILLMIHNTHHYLEFFKAIRENIAKDTLPSLITVINEQQAKHDEEIADKYAEKISSISSEPNVSPFKKLKNATSH